MENLKRVVVLSILSVFGILYFWLASRYPDLDAKALMASTASVSDTLSPWPLFQISPDDSFLNKVFFTTLNWINSNLKGMAFGIALGAAFLTLFSYIKLPESKGTFRNTFYGFLLGSPLGVCVNCAAPVFKGILESKRLELAMAAMLSSPTMNIIVLTMVFTFFPFYMGVIKILFTLICVFIGIPLINKFLVSSEKNSLATDSTNWLSREPEVLCGLVRNENWLQAIRETFRDYFSRLRFIAFRLIPLMILAGFLGALFSHLIPSSIFESEVSFLTLALAALFGVLLPVPIAFDVILVNAFYAQGMPESIVLILLCSLGIVSLFSFMVIWSSVSWRWAVSLISFCFLLTLVVGVSADGLHEKFYIEDKLNEFSKKKVVVKTDSEKNHQSDPIDSNTKIAKPIEFITLKEDENGKIQYSPYKSTKNSERLGFEKLEGSEIGIDRGFQYGIRDYTDPFWVGRGTASGDYDNDGWQDLVLGSNQGFVLYKNIGGHFQRQKITNPNLENFQVFAVALVDLDNNGWLDIFFSTYNNGNFVIHNDEAGFNYDVPVEIPNNNGLLTVSPAFADLDGNGLLDIVNGNMALGVITGSHHMNEKRNNSLVFNGGMVFRDIPLETTSGETMSTLISDINNDGLLDIYFSNDFVVPDKLLLGNGRGFKPVAGRQFIQKTPFFSMSADSGDINNDLKLDFLTTGTTISASHTGLETIDGIQSSEYTQFKGGSEICKQIKDEVYRKQCLTVRNSRYIEILQQKKNVDFNNCYQLNGETKQQRCLLAVMWQLVTQNATIENCESHFSDDARLRSACEVLKQKGKRYTAADISAAIPQEDNNFLYRFDETTKTQKAIDDYKHPGGWTWNSRIADLDNDGWQDIINAEGAVRKEGYGWNVLMRNRDGKHFEQKQFTLGFNDDFGLFSFTLIDMDNDGDLDIIGNSSEGPVQVYRNNTSDFNKSIAIELNDAIGNKNAIGAKITIVYDNGRQSQIREIKASGGYMSFDPAITYFGLGFLDVVESIIVQWPDNNTFNYAGPFESQRLYQLSRN